MRMVEIALHRTGQIFIDVDADKLGELFAHMNNEEQIEVLAAMVKHMKPHRVQWDFIAIELEKGENRQLRDTLRDALFPSAS